MRRCSALHIEFAQRVARQGGVRQSRCRPAQPLRQKFRELRCPAGSEGSGAEGPKVANVSLEKYRAYSIASDRAPSSQTGSRLILPAASEFWRQTTLSRG